MAALTWRNVEAPDFRGSMAGYQQFSNMLGNAFDSASQGLDQASRINTDAADKGILGAALKINDPKQLQEALANTDLTGMSRAGMEALAGRQNDLLNQAAKSQALEESQYGFGRTQKANSATDNAQAAIQEYFAAAQSGVPGAAQAVQSKYKDLFANLSPGQLASLGSQAQGFTSGQQGINRSQFNDNIAVRNDNDAQTALAAEQRIRRNVGDQQSAIELLNDMKLSPAVESRVLGALGKAAGGDPFGSPAGGSAGGLPGGGGASFAAGTSAFAQSIPFAETRDYVSKITSKAGDVTGTNAEKAEKLLPFLINQESGGDNNAVSPKGAEGLTQVMPATGTDPGFGVAPLKDKSPEEYKRFGKDYLTAMLDRYDGNVEQALAAYNAGPGKADEWIAASAGAVRGATNAIGARVAQDQGNGTAVDFLTNMPGTSAPIDYAKAIADRWAPGAQDAILNKILEVKQAAGNSINDAQAASIVTRSMRGETGLMNWLLPDSWHGLGNGQTTNQDYIDSQVQAGRSGQLLDQATAIEDAKVTAQTLAQAQQVAAASTLQMNNLAKQVQYMPERQKQFERVRTQALRDQKLVKELLEKQRNNAELNPRTFVQGPQAAINIAPQPVAVRPAGAPPDREILFNYGD